MNETRIGQQFGNFNIIRIIAATCIIFHHYQQIFEVSFNGLNFWGGKFFFGYLVELFFMISGFLTLYSEHKERSVLQSLKKKYFRVLPVAWLSMVCYLIITLLYKAILHTSLWSAYWGDRDQFTIKQIVTSFLMVNQGWVIQYFPAVNNPTWYLNVLMLCYIIYYSITWICQRIHIPRITVFAVLIIISMAGRYLDRLSPFFWDNNKRGYTAFFLGVLLCKLFLCLEKRKFNYCVILMTIISICIIGSRGIPDWYLLVIFVFPALLMILLSIKNMDNNLLKNLGAASFEVYLFHFPLMKLWTLIFNLFSITIKHSYLSMMLFAAIVWVFSILIYKFYEIPINRKLGNVHSIRSSY